MYGIMTLVEMGLSLALFVWAWLAARKASRLRSGGTAERLHRRTRQLLLRTGWLTLHVFLLFSCLLWMIATLPAPFWHDRLLLNAPLIGAPMLAVWFTTVPMLWRQWKYSGRARGPLHASLKRRLSSRLYVMPYEAAALGAVTSFYFAVVSPVPYDPPRVAAPLTVYVVVMIGLWMHHDRRYAQLREWLRAKRAKLRSHARSRF